MAAITVDEDLTSNILMDASGILLPEDFIVDTLGPCTIPTTRPKFEFVSDAERVLLQSYATKKEDLNPALAFEVAGQREKMYFQPQDTTVGIVTCGGLCPGLNNVCFRVKFV